MPSMTQRLCAQLSIYLLLLASGGVTAHAAVGTLADSSGEVVAWGSNSSGQLNVPADAIIAVSAGDVHSLGLRSDGTLSGWGNN